MSSNHLSGRIRNEAYRHQSPAAVILTGDFANRAIIFGQPVLDLAGMFQQAANASTCPAWQSIKVSCDIPTQLLRALWQRYTEFQEQTSQPVIDRGSLFDETLPCPMKAKRRLLVLVLERHKAHTGSRYRFADSRGIGGVVLAAFAGHPIRGD